MKLRRYITPAVLLITLLVQFLPGTVFTSHPVAATACDAAEFVADVTIPDGTVFAPGSALVKTWRLKNVGSCTWTTSYAIVFYSGSSMGAPAVVNLPASTAPGATVDVTVNMTAPASAGHYRGHWMLRNASSVLFGVGPYGSWTFFIDILVSGTPSSSTAYDFVANYASAIWTSGAGNLPKPGTDGDAAGFVIPLAAPVLESGSTGPAGLLTNPQNITDGYIQGVYPAFSVQSGDHFLSIINCQYGATNCYVTFQLNYQIGGGPIYTLKSFKEKTEGLYYNLDVNLSSLAGQNVTFILKVLATGSPSGDRAVWSGARISRLGGSLPPPPPSSTCDKAWFVADVTIPDGTILAAGAPFTKTWRLQNVGSCTWTTSYKLVFVGWDLMGASATSYNLPVSVAPGGNIDLSVNLTAPLTAGNFYGYWILQNASGVNFGVGASGTATFFVNIRVLTPSPLLASSTTITADAPDPSAPSQAVPVNVTVSGTGATPTGTVAITGADTNCSITLSGGSGTCNVVFSTTGTKTLTATYSGDPNYVSSSDTESHIVSTLTASITTITADTPDPSIPGQVVAVNVTVSGSGTIPTGTVGITGADTNCTITLAAGTGTCNVIFTTGGSKTLTATYSGNVNYAGSSDTESHTVSTGSTVSSTTITSDIPDPSTPGQAVVVTVTVSGAGIPVPSGTVYITGADTNCSILLLGGSGSCNATFTSTGNKTLTASYSGDGVYAPSSGTASHVVNKGSTTTTITADTPDPSVPTQAVAVSFTVNGAGVTPTGTVAITGADVNCSIALSGGTGSCNVVFNTIGAKVLTATYGGDGNYLGSVDTENHDVKNATTTTITSDTPDPSLPGGVVNVSFTVTGTGVIPTGSVTLTGPDGCPCGPVVLDGTGSGSWPVVYGTAGAKIITATYDGDVNYVGSVGTANHTVSKGASTTLITGDAPDPTAPFASILVSVNVSGAGVIPTGSVGVSISGAPSTCNLTLDGGGNGSCNVVISTVGAFTITANYSGDGNYLESSDTEIHNVN